MDMWPVSVRRREPEARSQILMVRSPAPLANHWLFGSTAKARTQPRCPDITRMSSHGACHSGFGCWTFSLRTRLEDGRWRCGVGPLAFGGAPAPEARSANAVDVLPLTSLLAGSPSIIFAVVESEPSSFCFFRFPAAAAVFCFAASAGGSSLTSLYSLLSREERPARSARKRGSSVGLLS